MQKKNLISLSTTAFVHKPARRTDYSLRLDYNELPYSAAWLGDKDGDCLHALNRYPEDDNEALVQKIAQTYRLPVDEIAVTHGVDEAMDRFIQLHAQKSFVLFKPTFFGFIDRLEANDAVFRTYDLGQDFKITPSDYEGISKNDIVVLLFWRSRRVPSCLPQIVMSLLLD
jgi:histidinol-phosphate/aromatic aminotransferase/cobyric acid decarboxylase-like protein